MKKKPAATNPRDDLGLTAAEGGDIGGLLKFIGLIQCEVTALAAFSILPDPICLRLKILGRDSELLGEFVAGYQAAGERAKKP